ncbi:uncharacterized protein LOC114717868 [Neltuma alba]|uniref:uncharacterized protein LOC114717868 n=1 Tax=Neltuma alba TaxID=207710 RepID=UPI0010A36BFB|nr:uncharacterized protein LOC114717868 [Prosopis alba]
MDTSALGLSEPVRSKLESPKCLMKVEAMAVLLAQYDVFLSFRGEDTRASFTSHLYSALSNVGILVFKDDLDLPRGNHISIELPRGIERSTISIIIFSKNYAGSKWCLNELSKIMEFYRVLGRVILPVFYDVDPSEVRNQMSSFGAAFRDLIQRSSPTENEVSRWRIDLREAGGIAGFVVLNSKNESKDIKTIVEHVCKILDKKDLFIANHPVGVDSRLQDLIKISKSHSMNDVLLLGIWGMGGIGKTTIAKAIYNKIGRTFDSRSFLSNIREVWGQDNGPISLQQQLYSEISKTTMVVIRSIDSGKITLKESLCHKKALVVLDDVNEVEQLNTLFGSRDWFGPGSRIIITSRDRHLLELLEVDHVYKIKEMDRSESIELFSWHAFKQLSPKEAFIDLSRNIVAYSGGLPLALEILGSYLFERTKKEWRSVLDKLKRIPNDEIQKKLRISFDGLGDDIVKEIFLDVSCFFIGMYRSDVTQILDGCGLFPDIGISVLVERSLVTVDEKNKLGMHDLLRDMGREIIREQSPKELGKRSRLWFHEDVHDVLSKHTGTGFVEGLALNLSQTNKDCFCTNTFKQMKALRLLRLGNVELDGDYKYISRDLRWLYWRGFPLKYIPANLYQKNLVAIELKYNSLKQVWREPQLLERLKILNCSHSPFLMQTPDFSKLPNLEKLILKNCPKLSMVHPTIGHANQLLLINLKDCTSLFTLPRSIYNLKSLKTLILSGCIGIEKLEEDIEQMDSLTTLVADDTAITQVPLSLPTWHDAFLSFRGEDTRACFTSHLFSALTDARIVVFKDDTDVPRGKRISTELLFGIGRSTIYIIIFSKNYAGSRWCLIELSEIMKRHRAQGRVVLPVFYGVDPSVVHNQLSSFGEAFQHLIHKNSPPANEVSRWRTDLREAGGIEGFVMLNSKNEREDIQNIVDCVCEILDKKDLFIANYPVEKDSHMQHLIRMSKSHPTNDVHKYDVFLSFRSKDTWASFTSHLYASLGNAGLVLPREDDDLSMGNDISIQLPLEIERSTMSIIIFSKDYAGSRCCLNELSKIMELYRADDQVVLPVFYGVDPSEVRNRLYSFGTSFQLLIQESSPTKDQVSRWETDLHEAGGIAGLVVLNSKNESEDIKKIVEHVRKMLDKKDLFIAKHLVGVDSRLQDLINILQSYSVNGVLLLGICGIGGIGKTTIAKAIYNKIGRTFESKCFLPNIREVWGQYNGPVKLQHQLLSEICKTTTSASRSIDSRKITLEELLPHKRALLVIDGVNEVEQLNALFGSRKCFGPGSRIIITTRDKHLLKLLNMDHVYTMKNMEIWESIELFCWHAFKQPYPKTGFIDLSRNIVAYSGGVPLVLEVLGSHLFDREEKEWISVLDKLKRIPNDEIQEKLKISFDGLTATEKQIFLDISFFFIGMDRSDVTRILDACGFFSDMGISVLVERSLVIVDEKNKLSMHDLLRDMGREIVQEQSPKQPGKRSRLWFNGDVLDVLSKHTGTEFVEGLALNLSQTHKDCFSTKAFEKMKSLRLLRLDNVDIDGDYRHISRDLKWLCWHGFPLKYIPANFYQENLVAIELKYSNLRQVWRETQLLHRLKILNCSHSPSLMQTPDFTKLPNLEKLNLKNCRSLCMVHHSIGCAHKLLHINLKNCTNLRTLPRSIYNLKSLKTLILAGCAMIERLEEDIEQMDSLTTLVTDETAIRQVPFSFVRLKSVGFISIGGYSGLSSDVFPSLISSWMSPTNNPLSLISTYVGMTISSDILNRNIPSPSSICDNQSKLQSLFLKITSENDPEVTRGASKILESSHARICMDKATVPNTSKILEIESSVLSGHTSRSENCLRHLLIQIGNNDQVTATLLENISQGLTTKNYGDDYVLPGDNYPYWQSFKGQKASVKFKVPQVSSFDLKGIIICCVYFPSCDLGNKACESCISLMIINYTKKTTLHYRQDSLTSFEEAELKEIISNLDSDDQVEVIIAFGNGYTMERTAVYLKYYESFDEQIEHLPPPSKEIDEKPMQTYVRRRKRQKID